MSTTILAVALILLLAVMVMAIVILVVRSRGEADIRRAMVDCIVSHKAAIVALGTELDNLRKQGVFMRQDELRELFTALDQAWFHLALTQKSSIASGGAKALDGSVRKLDAWKTAVDAKLRSVVNEQRGGQP